MLYIKFTKPLAGLAPNKIKKKRIPRIMIMTIAISQTIRAKITIIDPFCLLLLEG